MYIKKLFLLEFSYIRIIFDKIYYKKFIYIPSLCVYTHTHIYIYIYIYVYIYKYTRVYLYNLVIFLVISV